MNCSLPCLWALSAIPLAALSAKTPAAISRAFEFRAVTNAPSANGETDFKGKTAVFSTEERVAFLSAYADYAAAWFGDPRLDQLAVTPAEAQARLAQIKPQPLPSVRRSLRLNDGWKKAGIPAVATNRPAPWRTLPGAKLADGALLLPAGDFDLLDLTQSAGWRYEISWRARLAAEGARAVWRFGTAEEASFTLDASDAWRTFRLQADLVSRRGYLSLDSRRIADFPLAREKGASPRFAVAATGGMSVDDLVFIDYRPTRKVHLPYTSEVLADDAFDDTPAPQGWANPGYRDDGWSETSLPAAHGGFREAGEDLYLRRQVELPAARRAWLEIEALDPSGEVHVNGKLAGVVENRRPVLLDVTRFVRPGANTLALKVNHFTLKNPMGHMSGDLAVGWFAGRTTLHLLSGDAALRDLRVHTEALAAGGSARQTHRLLIENSGDRPFAGTLHIGYRTWFPAEGREVVRQGCPVSVKANSTQEMTLTLEVPAAEPWSPERPALYAVTATLSDDTGKPVDDVVTTAGIRTVAQRDGLFLLNNAPAMLNGAQNMGLRPVPAVENSSKFNRCAPAQTLISEMLAIKKMGGNLLRVHVHAAIDTPDGINDPRLAEFADQLGLALMWNSPAWLRSEDERAIDCASAGHYMRQVYNHPSIVMWEMGNHPNKFKKDDGPERTHAFVRRTVAAVLSNDTSRLITPTTFWQHTHYANDRGTVDWKNRAITPVPEYTHPLVTRGTQDAVTGYGAEWTNLRAWPTGFSADCLTNRIRAFFNFEHEESAAQPNWALSAGWPWHQLRSYEAPYEEKSIGRVLGFDEWRASQAWQAFSAYESMRKQIWRGVSGFSWCTLEGGANSGTYEKPLLDPFGHAKLAWHIHKIVFQPVLAGSDDVDTVYGPQDRIVPCVFNLGPARTVDLTVTVKTTRDEVLDKRTFPELKLAAGRSLLKLPAFRPKLPAAGYCVIEYAVSDTESKLDQAPRGTFTLAVIPDTQRYHGAGTLTGNTNAPSSNPALESRVSWLAGNLNAQQIVFVSHMGDLVDRNNASQWGLAKTVMARLHGRVPYGLCVGNHDLQAKGDSSLFQEHFGAGRFKEFPWYGGTYAGLPGQGPRISGNNANSFQLLSAGGIDFVILHLECNAPDDVLAWADGVLDSHAKRMAIVATHMYLGPVTQPPPRVRRTDKAGLGRMCWKKVHGARGNTPQQMWEECFSKHSNLFLVLAGDQSFVIATRLESRGVNGNVVHEVMQDYPRATDQDDWIRLYRFDPARKKIRVMTYSPCQGRLCDSIGYLPDIADHQFELDITDAIGRYRSQAGGGSGR